MAADTIGIRRRPDLSDSKIRAVPVGNNNAPLLRSNAKPEGLLPISATGSVVLAPLGGSTMTGHRSWCDDDATAPAAP